MTSSKFIGQCDRMSPGYNWREFFEKVYLFHIPLNFAPLIILNLIQLELNQIQNNQRRKIQEIKLDYWMAWHHND